MRALAGMLRSRAGQLTNASAAARGDARRPVFEGPAGDRFRSRIGSLTGALGDVEDGLRSLARRIDAAADEVDASQRAHDAAVAENAREAAQQHELAAAEA